MEFAVRSTDLRFLELLRELLGRFRVDEGPTDILFSADCGVEKALPGGKVIRGRGRLYFQTIVIYSGTVREEMAGRLISGIRDWTNNQSNEFFRLRAAGTTLDGGALLLPSEPQPHLPALAAHLLRGGGRYLGDEIVNVDPVLLQVHPMTLPLLVDAEDLRHFPDLQVTRETPRRRDREDEARVLHRRPVLLEELGAEVGDPSPIQWIVFPRFEPGGPSELGPLGGSEALFRLAQAGLNMHIWRERSFPLMQDLLARAWVGQLRVGSLPDAAQLLLDEFQSQVKG